MRIGPTSSGSIFSSRVRAAAAARRSEPTETDRGGSRALVPVEPIVAGAEPGRIVRHRVDAAFLAQLLAGAEDPATTRRVRRIEPARGAAIYARTEGGESLLVPGYLVDVAR